MDNLEPNAVLGEDDSFSKDEEILSHLKTLKMNYGIKKGGKGWQLHHSLINGDLLIDPQQLDDDFNRELKIYGNSLENTKTMIEKIIKANIPVWRPNDYKAETFKDDQHMKKVEKYLEGIKKKKTVVERRKDLKNKKKFGNEAHKRHVKVKQLKNAENKAERQKKN